MKSLLFILIIFSAIAGAQEKSKSGSNSEIKDGVYTSADKMPEIIGGLQVLTEKIKYPDEAKEQGIEGMVFISMIVDEKGEVYKPEVLKGAHRLLDKAAITAVKKLKFMPGENSGKKVKVKLTLPISFKLNGKDKKVSEGVKADMKSDQTENKILTKADAMPEIEGGMEALAKNIFYPEEARANKVQGKVFISAVISEKGEAEDLKVLKGIGSGCDEAALEAVKRTRFIPGKKDGKNVKVQITIPIQFKLE